MSIEGKMVIERVEHERLLDIEKKYLKLCKQHERLKNKIEKYKKMLPPKPTQEKQQKKTRSTTRLTEVLT